jgi:hypothetical protein
VLLMASVAKAARVVDSNFISIPLGESGWTSRRMARG